MHKGNYTVSNEANVFLPLGSLPVGTACGFSFVNRTQQRVRGLSSMSRVTCTSMVAPLHLKLLP